MKKDIRKDYYLNYAAKGLKKKEVLKKQAENLEKKLKKQHLEVFLSTDNNGEEDYV